MPTNELLNTHNELKIFAGNVVGKAKNNLKAKGKVASKRLYNSLDAEILVHKNSFTLSFEMEDYGVFVDYGVEGIGGMRKYKDGKKLETPIPWKKKRVTNKRFSYGSPTKKNSNGRFLLSLNGWTIKKGIAPRSASGKFKKRSGLLRAIRSTVIHEGLETTSFFTNPFEKEYKNLPDELVEAYALDMDSFLETSL